MSEQNIVVSVKNLEKSFEGRKVLDDITLDVYKGETFVIMGGSGSGKSTLMRIMTGGISPEAGQVYFSDKEISRLKEEEKEMIKRQFGMSFQSAALLDSLTVEQNVSLPLKEHTKLTSKVISIIAKMKLNLVGLQGFESYLPSMLSGGMRKRAGLARALSLDPEILFLDEPTAGLDPIGAAAFDNLIGELKRALGLTVVMVTHDLDSLHAICDRIAVLIDKRVKLGTIAGLLDEPDPWIQEYCRGPRGRAAQATATAGNTTV